MNTYLNVRCTFTVFLKGVTWLSIEDFLSLKGETFLTRKYVFYNPITLYMLFTVLCEQSDHVNFYRIGFEVNIRS